MHNVLRHEGIAMRALPALTMHPLLRLLLLCMPFRDDVYALAMYRRHPTSAISKLLASLKHASASLDVARGDTNPGQLGPKARLEYFLRTGHFPSHKMSSHAQLAYFRRQGVFPATSAVGQLSQLASSTNMEPIISLRGPNPMEVHQTAPGSARRWHDPGATCSAGIGADPLGAIHREGVVFVTGDIVDLALPGLYRVIYGCTIPQTGRKAATVQRLVRVVRRAVPMHQSYVAQHVAVASTGLPTPAPMARPKAKHACKHGRIVGQWSSCTTMCGPGKKYRIVHEIECTSRTHHRTRVRTLHQQSVCMARQCRKGMIDQPHAVDIPKLDASSRRVGFYEDDDHLDY